MEKLIVSTFLEEGSLTLHLDDVEISKGENQIEIELKSGHEYIVHWFVRARPRSLFSITVSSPKSAEYRLTRIVGSGGKEFGGYHFKL